MHASLSYVCTPKQAFMKVFYISKHICTTSLLCLGLISNIFAQTNRTGQIQGKTVTAGTDAPASQVHLAVLGTKAEANSSPDGTFSIPDVPYGTNRVAISGLNIQNDTITVNVDAPNVSIGNVTVKPAGGASVDNTDIPTIAIDDANNEDGENANSVSESSSGFYVATDDPFLNVAAFVFGPYRFRPRGYDNSDVQVNGVLLQDLESGFAPTSVIGGLNDVFRNRTINYGLRPSEYAVGNSKGSTYISATAADQRKGGSVSYYLANRQFRNRIMATYSSGVQTNGWAYSFSGSRRWAQEGYVPGSIYDAFSFYGAVSKVTPKGQINLTAFGAPTRRSRTTAEIDESFDLAGTNFYNGSWGYQQGEKRNANVNNQFQPVIIANYTYKPTDRTRWNTALGYEFGKFSRGGLEFYNGYSPNPSYYRNLPYYYIYGINNPNPAAAAALTNIYKANPELLQIQWDRLYEGNYLNNETINDVNGIAGNSVTGRRSVIALRDEVDDLKKISFNSNITHVLENNITLSGGVDVIFQSDRYYKQLTDLLGGDFFLNYNQFAAQANVGNPSFTQNDLNNPNRLVYVGDKYGYDFTIRANQTRAWGQAVGSIKNLDYFITLQAGSTSFSREGHMRNGLFPDNSFGKSEAINFFTYKGKGGLTYRLNARNALFAYGGYFADAPKIEFTYISERTRDFTVPNAQTYITKTAEVGYAYRSPTFNLRATGYVSDVTGNTLIKRFFNDDPDIQSFVNFVMQNVNTRSIGTELYATYKFSKSLTAIAVAAIGQSFYTNRPEVAIYQDNIPSMVPVTRQVYINNYYLGVGPQSIYNFGIKYSPRKWHINANFNYMDRNYVEINPDRRTQLASDLVNPTSQLWKDIYEQERLPSAFTVDLSAGTSFDLNKYIKAIKHRTSLNVNFGIYNLLDNQNIIMSGFEQLRYDFRNSNPYKFPNRYMYAFGRNFFISAAIRF